MSSENFEIQLVDESLKDLPIIQSPRTSIFNSTSSEIEMIKEDVNKKESLTNTLKEEDLKQFYIIANIGLLLMCLSGNPCIGLITLCVVPNLDDRMIKRSLKLIYLIITLDLILILILTLIGILSIIFVK